MTIPAIGIHHTSTEDSPWDGPAAVAAMPAEYATLHYCHAWWSADAAASSHTAGDDDADDKKSAYSFPHHKKDGGPANVPGCRNVLARVANSSIPAGDKAGVRKHAQAHLDDANKKSNSGSRLLLPSAMQATLRRIHNLTPPSARKWYRFTNAAEADDGSSTLYIFGPIGGWFGANAEDFVEDLAQVSGPLNVHINSGGGDAFEGITISNLLRNHPSTVNGIVTGMAASAASIIAMGCDSLTMSPGSQLMIHRAATSVYGNRDDMAEVMDMLERMDTSLAGLYQLRAGGDLADWESAMQAETWYTPQEAVDAGLADHIAEPPNKAGDDEDEAAGNGATGWGNTTRRDTAPVAAVDDADTKCPSCGKFNKADADTCTECGADMGGDDGDDEDGDTDDKAAAATTTQTPVLEQPRAAAAPAPVPPPVVPAPQPVIDPEVVRAAFRSAFSAHKKEAR
ncbi:MAG TPA: head maturation protease, ClpP-related [Pseudonocardiaceae bacterium]|jgi:ATP-dependent protease ClpP protease subunit|nr:head maturation protease, ClpP-related [Pseudonocardiaceae bacterium]